MRQRGFTLLEVLVALVILSTAGMAIFSWVESNLEGVSRVRDSNLQSAAKEDAIVFMQTVNPMLTPSGDQKFGRYSLHWESAVIGEVSDNQTESGQPGIYQVGLYKTHIQMISDEGQNWFAFDLKQVGYKRVREPPKGLFG